MTGLDIDLIACGFSVGSVKRTEALINESMRGRLHDVLVVFIV